MSELAAWCKERAIRFLRLCWIDSSGVLRAEAVATRHLDSILADGLPLSPAVQAALPLGGIAEDPELSAVGQVWLAPDLATLRVLPWEPSHAACLARFVTSDGQPWAHCPRAALDRALEALALRGLEIQAAFEHEFMLLRREGSELRHFEASTYASAHGLDHAGPILDRMAEALEEQQVDIRAVLKEAGLSQFEFSTEHGSALEAAHRFGVVRETIAAIAGREELVGTCLPLVFEPEPGNGWHLHFSLWRNGVNLTGLGDRLGRDAESFVAGIHEHLPALLALTVPSPNSFRRIRPGAWCGAYRAWGYDHKEAPVRVPSERRGAPTNVELKCCDGTANPYLALAGVIAAGLDGMRRDLRLPDPIDSDPARLSEKTRRALGIDLLPQTLGDAVACLRADPVLCDMLGEPLARSYAAVKDGEISALEGVGLEEEVARLVELY